MARVRKKTEAVKASEKEIKAENVVHNDVIHCRASGSVLSDVKWQLDTPVEFQWMPGGRSVIEANWNGKPIELCVECDEKSAEAVQASYSNWISSSRQEPFGCLEHKEEEAAIRLPAGVGQFTWKTEPEPGVYCTALPTELGVRNVNGRIHRSWSPSFTTDAEYNKATLSGGVVKFPAGVRGSKTNPAKITGCAFSVGSLTNKPAFRNIMPVKAKENSEELSPEFPNLETENAITAAGTSEGVRKSWDTKHSGGVYGYVESFSPEGITHVTHHAADSVEEAILKSRAEVKNRKEKQHNNIRHGYVLDGQYHETTNSDEQTRKRDEIAQRYYNALSEWKKALSAAVAAKQADPQPEPNKTADTHKGLTMKFVTIKARDGHAAGSVVEFTGEDAIKAVNSGDYITEAEHKANTELAAVKAREKQNSLSQIEASLSKAVARRAVFPKGEGEKSLETVRAKFNGLLDRGNDVSVICELIDNMPGEADKALASRVTASANDGMKFERINSQGVSIDDASKAYVTAREPMTNLIRSGRWKEAQQIAAESAHIMSSDVMAKVDAGSDFMLKDTIKAADFTDPDSQVGTLATGLVLQRNLGFLVNKLQFLKYISTDLSAEPAKFGQPILTRYITPPNVLTFVPGTGFTSDSTTISNASAGTTQSGATTTAGTRTVSVPSATDVTVTMNMFKATEIEIPVSKLSSTVRNLFGEQRGAQLYSLAENINQHFLTTLFSATWSGVKTSYTKPLDQWSLKSLIGLKNAMTISKIPDMGRFALLHSFYYDKTMEDANLLSAQAILSLVNKDASAFNGGELPALFNINPIESQLAAANASGTLVSWTDDSAPGSVSQVGFAGNQASAVFVARPPQDYTATATQLGIPITAAVELVTEPNTGLTAVVFKYADNGKMSIVQRVCLMWGDAQGDPRQGIVLKNA